MIDKIICVSLFSVALFAQPQASQSYNKLRAKHLSKSDGLLGENNNYVVIKSSSDLKEFIKDGCVNVGLDTSNSNRGNKINYVSIQNVRFDASSICDEFDGVNFGIISDETLNSKLTNYVKIKNSNIGESVNAGIIIKSNQNSFNNVQLKNNVEIKNTELGRKNFRKTTLQTSRKKRRQKYIEKEQNKGSIDEENEKW